jgi:hypothetical protein
MERIISGGQTGVDRAALDVAMELSIPCGGWCPRGRRAEDGVIPTRYPLQEAESPRYPVRTALNVRDSDGTLILTRGKPDRGTALTRDLARRYRKPYRVVDFERTPDAASIRRWIEEKKLRTLNVAGPRESSCPGIHEQAKAFLRQVLCNRDATAER